MGSQDATLLKLDGLAHLLFMEPERERVMQQVVDWVSQRCSTAVGGAAAYMPIRLPAKI